MERKEAGRGTDPHGRTCASHSDPAEAGFGSGDSLSKCPLSPGEMAWEQMQDGSGKVSRHSTLSEGPTVLGTAGTELAEHPRMGRQTLQCVSLDSPCMSLGLGPPSSPHHGQLCMDSSSFKRAQPQSHPCPCPGASQWLLRCEACRDMLYLPQGHPDVLRVKTPWRAGGT